MRDADLEFVQGLAKALEHAKAMLDQFNASLGAVNTLASEGKPPKVIDFSVLGRAAKEMKELDASVAAFNAQVRQSHEDLPLQLFDKTSVEQTREQKKLLEEYFKTTTNITDSEQKRRDYIKDALKTVRQQRDEVEKIKLLSDPRLIYEQVKAQKELKAAEEARAKLVEKEQKRQGVSGGKGGGRGREDEDEQSGKVSAALDTAGSAIGATVEKSGVASPALLKQFSMAMEDISGVLGQALLPIMPLIVEGVRLFGDILATILPSTEEAREALAPLTDAIIELFGHVRDVMADLGPVIRDSVIQVITILADVLKDVVPIVSELFDALAPLIEALSETMVIIAQVASLIMSVLMVPLKILAVIVELVAKALTYFVKVFNTLMKALGLGADDLGHGEKGMRASIGAASRPATFQAFDAYKQQLQIAAYSSPANNAQQNMPRVVSKIGEATDKIAKWTDGFTIKSLVGAMKGDKSGTEEESAWSKSVGSAAQAVDYIPGLSGLANTLRAFK